MVVANANAHYLWIEPGNSDYRLNFGEAEMLLKEKSPGRLDSFNAPRALAVESTSGKPEILLVTRATNHFTIAATPAAQAVVVLDESIAVRDLSKHGLGFAKTNYYARFARSDVAKGDGFHLPLDALSVQKHGGRQLTVVYRGQTLKGTKVQVIAPNTWMQEHETQADGTVQINTPWRGQYVVHVLFVDKTPGEFDGRNYDSVRNHYTLTFIENTGTDPGPAVAPKQTME